MKTSLLQIKQKMIAKNLTSILDHEDLEIIQALLEDHKQSVYDKMTDSSSKLFLTMQRHHLERVDRIIRVYKKLDESLNLNVKTDKP